MKGIFSLPDRYRVQNDPLLTERRVELAALLLTGLLLLQLVYSIARLSFLAAPEPIAPSLDILNDLGAMRVAAVDVAMREEIRNRPLFWPGRRPLPEGLQDSGAPNAGEGSKPTELDEVKIVGIFGAGDSAGIIALVKDKKRRILLGERLDGWTLEAVEPGEGVFASGARRASLTLERVGITARPDSGGDPVTVDAPRKKARKSASRSVSPDQPEQEAAAVAKARKQPSLSAGPGSR